ncbi:bifunctional lysylphosphatidylglycerol flippase/synthetase MprF [Nocardia sp. NPDC004068]|uniref:bifunctional lysylphosphatidylglycerol flippase/synthetase MprF n=1 Tax=Nocardia sp. NPDC004068 TaxID=3364303 RepID=UPI0036BCCEE1
MSLDLVTAPDRRGLTALRKWSHNPSGFLALNRGNKQFQVPTIDGAIFYREVGRHLIQLGGPFTEPTAKPALLRAFVNFAESRRKHVAAMQLLPDDASVYAAEGYHVNQFGSSYAVDLNGYTLGGKKFVKLRNKISRAIRAGLEIREVKHADVRAEIDEIDRRWLRLKGRFAREMEFMVGEVGGENQDLRRLFVGTIGGEVAGYVSYSPVYGAQSGWLHDLSRRVEVAPPGTMEAVNWHAIERFSAEGCGFLHFGLTPFTGMSADTFATRNRTLAFLLGELYDHGSWIYPAETQLQYKLKWNPALVIPDYLAYRGRLTPGKISGLLRAINMI